MTNQLDTILDSELDSALNSEIIDADTAASASSSSAPQSVVPMVFSDEQETFFSAVLDERINTLLIGKAGVGKSTAARELLRRAKERGLNYLHAAPTGVAAINVGGMTVHRLISKLGWFRTEQAPLIDFILVDEVSMLRADLFDKLDQALRSAMFLPEVPFGGIPMVLMGDPGQLPPVVKKGDADSDYVLDNYHTPYFWSAACYSQVNWQVIELTRVYRQENDARYPKLLNLVRKGDYERPLNWLNRFRVLGKNGNPVDPQGVILVGTNADAQRKNGEQLARLAGERRTYSAQISGRVEINEYPTEKEIELKVGARVMIIKNKYGSPLSKMRGMRPSLEMSEAELELVNGDVGTVTTMQDEGVTVLVQRTGIEHFVGFNDGIWEKTESVYDKKTKKITREVIGSFVQVPVRLAWAITIHKCQGATLQEFTLDVRRPLFAAGQAYVALSRGTHLEGLWIQGTMRPSDIKVCEQVAAFLSDFRSGVGIKPGSAHDMKAAQKDLFEAPKEEAKEMKQEDISSW